MRKGLKTTLCTALGSLVLAVSGANTLLAQAGPSLERVSDPAAVAVVEQYLKAIGGRDTLSKIQTTVTKYRNIKYSATGETVANIAFYMTRDYKYREEWDIEGFKIQEKPLAFVQIYNGQLLEGWVSMFDTVSALEGRTLEVFVWDKYIDDFFMQWQQDGYTLKHVGQGLVGGEEPADIIESTDFAGNQVIRYFFSKSNGLLLKKEWQDFTQKEVAKKEQYYKRYRRIAFSDGSGLGIQFPLQVEILVDGDLDTERVYREVKFNETLSDKLFERPEGEEFQNAIRSRADLHTDEGTPATDSGGVHGGVHGGIHGVRGHGTTGERTVEGSGPRPKVTSDTPDADDTETEAPKEDKPTP